MMVWQNKLLQDVQHYSQIINITTLSCTAQQVKEVNYNTNYGGSILTTPEPARGTTSVSALYGAK